MAATNGDAKAALEKSRKEKKEASMKRIIKVVEPENEVRSFPRGDSLSGYLVHVKRILGSFGVKDYPCHLVLC